MSVWLFERVIRIPHITDSQIAEMRHIEPVLRVRDSCMYQRIKGIESIHARETSFLWSAEPTGEEFTFDVLNQTQIITQHLCSIFFKPSLAEVYAWIRLHFQDNWRSVTHFCIGEPQRLGGSSDCWCQTTVMGGPVLVRGRRTEHGHELVEKQ